MTTATQRLEHLFELVYPRGASPRTTAEVATAVRVGTQKHPAIPISTEALQAFRDGEVNALTANQLAAVGSFFGIRYEYFTDDAVAAAIDADLARLALVREAGYSAEELTQALGRLPTTDIATTPEAIVEMLVKAKQVKPETR